MTPGDFDTFARLTHQTAHAKGRSRFANPCSTSIIKHDIRYEKDVYETLHCINPMVQDVLK